MTEYMHVNDARLAFLEASTGLTGNLQDLEHAWLVDIMGGGEVNRRKSRQDLWFEYLIGLGYTGTLADMRFEWLQGQGLTGSMADMWQQYWADLGAVNILLVNNMQAFGIPNGSYIRQSDFTYTDSSGTLQYGRKSREQLWVNSDPAPTLGSELVPDPNFESWTDDNPDGYAIGTENATNYITQNSGFRIVSDGTNIYARRNGDLTATNEYLVTVTVDVSLGSVSLRSYSLATTYKAFTSSGTYTFKIQAIDSGFSICRDNACDQTFTYLSIKPYTAPTGFTISETYAIPHDWEAAGLTSAHLDGAEVPTSAIVFGDNSVTRGFRYDSASFDGDSTSFIASCYVQMDDGSEPQIGTDFIILMMGNGNSPAYTERVNGTVYKVWSVFAAGSSNSNTLIGPYKTTGQSTKGFKVSGFMVEELPSANVLGPELVTDGDGSSDSFNKGTGWTYDAANQEWDCDGSQTATSNLTQSSVLPSDRIGKYFQCTLTVSNNTVGLLKLSTGGYNNTEWFSGNGTHSYMMYVEHLSSNDWIYIQANSAFIGSVDNISVKEIPAWAVEHSTLGEELVDLDLTNWVEGTNATISDEDTFVTVGGYRAIGLNSFLSTGSFYKLEVSASSPGDLRIFSYDMGTMYSSSVSQSIIFQATDEGLRLQAVTEGTHDITAFSIREILDPAIQPSPYTPSTSETGTVLIPATPPIESAGFAFMGSPAVNLIPYSEDFSQWSAVGAPTVEVADNLGPDNQSPCYRVYDTEGDEQLKKQINVKESTEYNFSLFVRDIGSTAFNFAAYDITNSTFIFHSDNHLSELNSSTFTRISKVFTIPAGCEQINIYATRASKPNAYIFGAQLTEGSQLYPYIPTDGTPTAMMPTEDVQWPLSDKLKAILGEVNTSARQDSTELIQNGTFQYVEGRELVTNGTFDADISSWSQGVGATADYDNGKIKVINSGGVNHESYQQDVGLLNGKYYLVSGTLSAVDNTASVFLTSSGISTTSNRITVLDSSAILGAFSTVAYIDSTETYLHLCSTGAIEGNAATFDNISVKEVQLGTSGASLSSGNLEAAKSYLVQTTETDHFGAGVVAGDFVTGLTTALDANNTVKEVVNDWSTYNDVSLTTDGLQFDENAAHFEQQILEAGQDYRVDFTVVEEGAGTLAFRIDDGNTLAASYNAPSIGSYSFTFSNPTTSLFRVRSEGGGWLGVVDNVSVRQIFPGEGTLIVEWTPGYETTESLNSGESSLLTSSGHTLLRRNAQLQNLWTYDGTTYASLGADPDTYPVLILRWSKSGNVYQVGSKSSGGSFTWGIETTFDGDYPLATDLIIGSSTEDNFHIKNIKFYDRAMTTAEIEGKFA